jgi:hypothetical protein
MPPAFVRRRSPAGASGSRLLSSRPGTTTFAFHFCHSAAPPISVLPASFAPPAAAGRRTATTAASSHVPRGSRRARAHPDRVGSSGRTALKAMGTPEREKDPMEYAPFAAVDGQARAVDRLTSLRVPGGSLAALAATRPLQTEVGKNATKCQEKVNKKVKKECGKQVAQCEFSYVGNSELISCCQFLRDCDLDRFSRCVV